MERSLLDAGAAATAQLDPSVWRAPFRPDVAHGVVKWHLANRRQVPWRIGFDITTFLFFTYLLFSYSYGGLYGELYGRRYIIMLLSVLLLQAALLHQRRGERSPQLLEVPPHDHAARYV